MKLRLGQVKLRPVQPPERTDKMEADDLSEEIFGYVDVLLGRVAPPFGLDNNTLSLMEIADVYHARAREIEMELLREERNGSILRNSHLYKFRTGELRSFLELSKRTAELGSRRLTEERLEFDMSREAM